MTFKPSEYNLAIRDEWRNSERNIGIKARAGSGKTSQLLWMAEDVDNGLFVSFSKPIVDELSGRLVKNGSKMTARTGHSLGFAACKAHIDKLPSNPVNGMKYYKLAQKWVDTYGKNYVPQEKRDVADALKDLTEKAMLHMSDGSDLNQLYQIASHYDIQTDQYMVEGVKWVIDQGYSSDNLSKLGISFTDMLYLPVMHDFPLQPINTLFWDEVQDATRLTLEFIRRSLDGRIVAVGDDKQNIFGFAGVSENAFYDVMDTFNCVQLPLNYCYRCGKEIIKLAQTIVPEIQSPEWMHDGMITGLKAHKLVYTAKSGDVILCRTNAPLIRTCMELIGEGIKAHVLGRDIGKTISAHIKKIMKLGKWSEFVDLTMLYAQRETDKIVRKPDYSQAQVDYINDIVSCILTVYQPSMLNESILIATIEALFSDDLEGVVLSTVHKFKGKEAERVFIINPDKLPLIWTDQKAHEYQQERNIQYVAYTRAKNELCFVE